MSIKNDSDGRMRITCQALVESGMLDRPFFESKRSLFAEMRLIQCMETQRDRLLQEGFDGTKRKALQALISGSAQYGLGALTLPAGGAGLVVGPVAGTVVDSLFAADAVASTVKSFKDLSSSTGEFSDILQDALSATKLISELKFEQFYQAVRKIIQDGLRLLGKKASDGVENVADRLREMVRNLIRKLTEALDAGIKLVIPDTAIGTAVSTSASFALQRASDNAYDLLTGAISEIGDLGRFITDPDQAPMFFDRMIENMIDFFRNVADKLKSTSILKSALMGSTGISIKVFGPSGIRKLADVLEDKGPGLVDLIGKVTQVIVPAAFAILAVHQCLMKGDYKSQEKGKSKDIRKESSEKSIKRQRNESKNDVSAWSEEPEPRLSLKDYFYFD